ncbi:MAG: DUF481 domain-containing protein [Kangiellaceae bacterium]
MLNTIYLQPSFKDSDDFRALNQFALTIDIAEKLKWKWQTNISYDSMPPSEVEKQDVTYSTVIESQCDKNWAVCLAEVNHSFNGHQLKTPLATKLFKNRNSR